MRSAGNFNSEWGYLAPAPSFVRTVRVVMVATAVGATAGAAVVLSLIDHPSAEHNRTAAIAAHAIVTSVQAAPATAPQAPHSAAAPLAAPVSMTSTAGPVAPSPVQTQSPISVAPQMKAMAAPSPVAPQVATQPPPAAAMQTPPAAIAANAAPAAAASAEPPPATPDQEPAAIHRSADESPAALENSAASAAAIASTPKPASGLASLSDVPQAAGAERAEAPDQALIPPQTVPPVKKPRPHPAYASNNKYQRAPNLGTLLRRLFIPHDRTSSYPNR